jgi:hypothetical protein
VVEDVGEEEVGVQEGVFVGVDALYVRVRELPRPAEVTHVAVYRRLLRYGRKHPLEYDLNDRMKQGRNIKSIDSYFRSMCYNPSIFYYFYDKSCISLCFCIILGYIYLYLP